MNNMMISRILLVLGLAIGMISFSATVGHIGSDQYLLVPSLNGGEAELETHAWYHALREVIGDVASMAILLLVFFGAATWRTPITWNICLIIMIGYYAPFWIGAPFSAALAAPSWTAEIVHIVMAALPLGALFLGRKSFTHQELSEAG
jgi:hypothetical protein